MKTPLGLLAWPRRLLEYGFAFAEFYEHGGPEKRDVFIKLRDELIADRDAVLAAAEKAEQPTDSVLAQRIHVVLKDDEPDTPALPDRYNADFLPTLVQQRLIYLREAIWQLQDAAVETKSGSGTGKAPE